MKQTFVLLLLSTLGITACETHDVPSLHEQLEGAWTLESYMVEQYNPSTNSLSRQEVPGKPSEYFHFSTLNKLVVRFDSTGPMVWTYRLTDARTLSIENKKWTIIKLDPQQLHLFSNERDSSFKLREIVRYQLKRP